MTWLQNLARETNFTNCENFSIIFVISRSTFILSHRNGRQILMSKKDFKRKLKICLLKSKRQLIAYGIFEIIFSWKCSCSNLAPAKSKISKNFRDTSEIITSIVYRKIFLSTGQHLYQKLAPTNKGCTMT